MVQIISFFHKIKPVWLRLFVANVLVALLTFAPQATAQTHISKTAIGELMGANPTELNWKTNEIIVPFDLPQTVWVDKVEFLLSAIPTGALRHHRNLHVRINGSDPIILKAQGQRFDARVKLDQKYLRRRGNKLYISGITTSSTCAGPNHAGWDISADRSFLVYYGRPMKRDLNLQDLASMWNQSSTKPSLVGLKVIGENKFRHESLILQGLSIRAGSVPKLRTAFSGNHIDVVTGLREDIAPYIRNKGLSDGTGAEIILDKGRPARLIITGDTSEQVAEAVDAFSVHKLPVTRRVKTTPYELKLQPVLSTERPVFENTHRLADAGPLTIANSWTTPALNFTFDAPFSTDKTGKVVLRLNGNEALSENSSLHVSLNNHKLGFTKIDTRRKTVKFDIENGILSSTNNTLEIISDLQPSARIDSCSVADTQPGFNLGLSSKIVLKGQENKSDHNVANLAVRTGPFATAKNLVIYSTAQQPRDHNSLLRLTGNIALISGKAWTHATYVEGRNPLIPPTDNLLILGPTTTRVNDLIVSAPKSLKLALKGQNLPQIEEQRIASILKVASSEGTQAIQLAAAASRAKTRSGLTGLMSLYDDPLNNRTVGIITSKPGTSFSQTAANLLKPEIWGNATGSVAVWNAYEAIMAQAPLGKLIADGPRLNTPSINLSALSFINFEKLDIMHDEMFLALDNIWQEQIRAMSKKVSTWGQDLSRWAFSFNKADPAIPAPLEDIDNRVPSLRTSPSQPILAANIPTPIVKPHPILKAANTNNSPVTTVSGLRLRGGYKTPDPKVSSPSRDRISLSRKDFKDDLYNFWDGAKSNVLTKYNEFKSWGKTINQTRVAKGQAPVIPSPLLALLLMVFGCLILLTITNPRQLR